MEVEVGMLIAVGGFVVGYFTFRRNRDKDIEKGAHDSARISTKLDHISGGVDSMRVDLRSNESRLSGLNDRLIRTEESSKQAHKRIDGIERMDEK